MHSEDTLVINPLERQLDTGDQVGNYLLGRQLGRGAHGVVYQATKSNDPRTFAIKVINTQGHPASFTDRILRECAITTNLHHPGIITVHEAGRIGSAIFIVMDIAVGKPCDHFGDGVLGWELAVQIVLQVARALDHAFTTAHIIHRDIKPANIVVDIQGGVLHSAKVVDFGLSRSVDEEGVGLTMTGMILGTPFYMSPEQARGERDLGFHTDLYALGATLFYLIAGRPPFNSGTPVEILVRHCNEASPELHKLVPTCPPSVSAAVARCLAKKTSDRFASFAELTSVLVATLEENPFDGASNGDAPAQRPSTRYSITSPTTSGGTTTQGRRSSTSTGSDALGELLRSKLAETSKIYRRQSTTIVVAEPPAKPAAPEAKPASTASTPAAEAAPKPAAARKPSLTIGAVFDQNYTITGTLGSGAMGEVYGVTDSITGNQLALKILTTEDMERPGAVRRFHSEAAALATIEHPAFPYFAGKGTYLGRDYLLMERVQGIDLKTWLGAHGGCMVEQGALNLMLQLAQAMDQAYAKCGMVHRDLKPANLMLVKSGEHYQLKIVDFGVSTYIDFGDFEDFSAREYRYIDDDSQGKAVGTPAFMSPEQCLGKPPSPMMDIYAIGCVFFRLITGRTPYQGSNPAAMMMKHLQDPPPVFTGLAEVSSGSDYLLKRCLAKNPRDRFQNYQKLEAAVISATHTLTSKLKRQGTEMYRRRE